MCLIGILHLKISSFVLAIRGGPAESLMRGKGAAVSRDGDVDTTACLSVSAERGRYDMIMYKTRVLRKQHLGHEKTWKIYAPYNDM